MDIHKPKAAHNLREFLIEIGTIICGILIALTLEQGIEARSWREKTQTAEAAVRQELDDQLAYAAFFQKLKPGLDERVDKLRAAVVADDHAEAARLSTLPSPIVMRAWTGTAWVAAGNEQIISRLDPGRRRLYETLHRQVDAELDLEWRIKDAYATLLSARLPVGGDAAIAQQIAAAEHLRSDSDMAALVANAMFNEAKRLDLHPTPEQLKRGLSDAAKCGDRLRPGAGNYVC